MMRHGWKLAGILVLAGCSHAAMNDPRYHVDQAGPYDRYQSARELALTGVGPAPAIIPRARPFQAPSAADIQGTAPKKVVLVRKIQTKPPQRPR